MSSSKAWVVACTNSAVTCTEGPMPRWQFDGLVFMVGNKASGPENAFMLDWGVIAVLATVEVYSLAMMACK